MTNDDDKKMTPTSANAVTPVELLPPTLHAPSMFSCEQLAGGTSKTEQAMALADDLASLQVRERKKKNTLHADTKMTPPQMTHALLCQWANSCPPPEHLSAGLTDDACPYDDYFDDVMPEYVCDCLDVF